MDDNIIDAEKDFEIIGLKKRIKELENKLTKYQITLKEIDEDADPNVISDEESICITQIFKLKVMSEERQLSLDEVRQLDILHKNLKLSRGESERFKSKSKAGKKSADELANIIKGK